jgi:hypothetical protein
MVYKPGDLKKKSSELIKSRDWAISALFTLFGVGYFVSEYKKNLNLFSNILSYFYCVLMILIIILILLWIWATRKDLQLLFEWLDPMYYHPPTTLKETIFILIIALVLSVLILNSRNPFYYGIAFTLYTVINYIVDKYLEKQLIEVFSKSRHRLQLDLESNDKETASAAKIYRKGLDVLEFHFIKRPYFVRHKLMVTFSSLGLIMGAVWKFKGFLAFGILSYLIFISTIIVSEIFLNKWRYSRDVEMRTISAELSEYLRQVSNGSNEK